MKLLDIPRLFWWFPYKLDPFVGCEAHGPEAGIADGGGGEDKQQGEDKGHDEAVDVCPIANGPADDPHIVGVVF